MSAKKSTKWLIRLVILAVIVALVAGAYNVVQPWVRDKLGLNTKITSIEDLKPDEIMGFKKNVDNAILGEAKQKKSLVVYEQEVQIDTEISSALLNLGIFEKTKVIHTFGTGVYTVDMSKITSDSIKLDTASKTVTLSIPRTALNYIEIDHSKTTFEDTQHAFLGFGEIKMTQEQQGIVDKSIQDSMRAKLTSSDSFANADEAALLEVYDVYQPLVEKLSPDLFLNVVFADGSTNEDLSAGSGK